MSDKRVFKVLKGGLAGMSTPAGERFTSAWITNTRLMGVVCLCIFWSNSSREFHQYFYFDAEEYGFDRYESYRCSRGTADKEADKELKDIENSLIGGLGGKKTPLTLKEAAWLLGEFIEFNRIHGIPLPANFHDLDFLLKLKPELNTPEKARIFKKSCAEIVNFNSLANYFMMRCVGKDFTAATFLAKPGVNVDILPDFSRGTLYTNAVRICKDRESVDCRSLVEAADKYYVVSSHLKIEDMKISACECVSILPVTEKEAYLQLSHAEFITIYSFDGGIDDFSSSSMRLLNNAAEHDEHDGKTFMIYHPNNSHVDLPDYYLYNDLLGIYHINDNGELLVAAPTLRGIRKLELNLNISKLKPLLNAKGSFEFNEPVLIQYLESAFTDFLSFIDAIKAD